MNATAAPEGILVVDKPVGPTSFDVVARLRRASRQRRIGHGGTLDPLASGVLPVFLGRATRLAQFSSDAGKEYRATLRLGVTTTTYDAAGEVLREADPAGIDRATLEAALARFSGEIEQLPPMHSAVQVGGKRLYELARQGLDVERPTRRVTISSIRLLDLQLPEATIEVACSKGTYIRTLVHDLGQALGVGAHLTALVRTRSGPFSIEQATSLVAIESAFASGTAGELLLNADSAVQDLPAITIEQGLVVSFLNGLRVGNGAPDGALARVYAADARFLGLARGESGRWQPAIVLVDRAQ